MVVVIFYDFRIELLILFMECFDEKDNIVVPYNNHLASIAVKLSYKVIMRNSPLL